MDGDDTLDGVSAGLADTSGTVQAMAVEAMSLNMPEGPHINKMPFTGVLVNLDEPSTNAPHGTNGKRIILSRSAAEAALPSLLGMGVDLKAGMDGHDAAFKIGIVTDAKIENNAVTIAGYIWANDHPKSALAIQLNKADLGFSFEAANIRVRSASDPILTIEELTFTGCAVLLRDSAAFRNTSLAAAAAKEQIMSEIPEVEAKVLVDDAVARAMEPITAALASIAATQASQQAVLEELKKSPELRAIEANAAMCAAVQPHVDAIRAASDGMENNSPPIGMGANGHVHHLRRIASHMGAEAQRGHLPSEYHDSGSAWAGADPTHQQAQHTEDDDVIIKDTPEFKELKASADKTAAELAESKAALAANTETLASMQTMLKDLKAQMDTARPAPQRQTISPQISAILARTGLHAPEEEGAKLSAGAVTDALKNVAGMDQDTTQRIAAKLNLARAGLLDPSAR